MKLLAVAAMSVVSVLHGCGGHVTEDSPRFNCRTMDNHVCGSDRSVTIRIKGERWTVTTSAQDAAFWLTNGDATFVSAIDKDGRHWTW